MDSKVIEIISEENDNLKKERLEIIIENMKLRERIRELEEKIRNNNHNNNHKRRFERYG